MKSSFHKIKRVTEHHYLELNRSDIIFGLREAGVPLPDITGIGSGLEIYVMVPGSGDWSNTALDLNEHPIRVEWKIEKDCDDEE